MEELKLTDWDGFEKDAIERNKKNDHLYTETAALENRIRQTGRTTKILVSALVAMTRGFTVTIWAPRGPARKYLLSQLQEMAESIGLQRSKVVKEGADVEFYDHLYWEMRE